MEKYKMMNCERKALFFVTRFTTRIIPEHYRKSDKNAYTLYVQKCSQWGYK